MKHLIYILILFCSCSKDWQELVRLEITETTGCSQVEVKYMENNDLITKTVSPSGFFVEYMRNEGTDIYFEVRPICPGTVKTIGLINSKLMLNATGSELSPAIFSEDASQLDKIFK
jgi:hypothetical protein